MTKHPGQPAAPFQVIAAQPEQASILANLLELYAYDFTEFLDLELRDDGRFGYTSLPLYWTDPSRHPFLFHVEGSLAGFALVKRGSDFSSQPNVWDMAEFFIVRKYRRRGISTQIAHDLWNRFPGPWEIRVMQANVPAYNFWTRAITQFTAAKPKFVSVQRDGQNWNLFSFDSKRGPA